MGRRIKARVQQTNHVHIHNDLDGAAHYLQTIIRGKLDSGTKDAIYFDCMACATMIAFAFEAYLNFFGAKLIDPWNERQRVNAKIKQVFGALEFSPDWQSRPFKGVQAMKELRDIFAHGKPATFEMDEVVEAEAGELDGKRYNLGPAWETLCMPVHVLDAYEDLVAVWKIMLARSGMAEFDAMDHGEGGVTYLGDVDQASNTDG